MTVGRNARYEVMSWKTIKSETLLQSGYVTVKKDRVQLPDGAVIDDFYTVKIQDAALIVALTEDNNILLKKEYRYACKCDVIECPAGMIEEGEDPRATAERELFEETGYMSGNWTYLGPTWESTSKLTNTMHLLLAQNCRKVGMQHLDRNEHVDVICVPLRTAVEMVMSEEINANSSAHAILKIARLLGE